MTLDFANPGLILGAVPDYGIDATLEASEADPAHTGAANLLSDLPGAYWRTATLSTPKVATLRVDFGKPVSVGSVGLADLNLSAAGRIAVQTSDTAWPVATRVVPSAVLAQPGLGGGLASIVGDPEAVGGLARIEVQDTVAGHPRLNHGLCGSFTRVRGLAGPHPGHGCGWPWGDFVPRPHSARGGHPCGP